VREAAEEPVRLPVGEPVADATEVRVSDAVAEEEPVALPETLPVRVAAEEPVRLPVGEPVADATEVRVGEAVAEGEDDALEVAVALGDAVEEPNCTRRTFEEAASTAYKLAAEVV